MRKKEEKKISDHVHSLVDISTVTYKEKEFTSVV
jgi:hypothetical protein